MRDRKGRIIYYAGSESFDKFGELPAGGFTVDEWLIYWTWMYFINQVNFLEYEHRLNYITVDMPGALSNEDWVPVKEYIKG